MLRVNEQEQGEEVPTVRSSRSVRDRDEWCAFVNKAKNFPFP
jgi:hypothetical protein